MKQYKQRNFYTEDYPNDTKILYSYNTPVGVQKGKDVFFTLTKYSRTTSKQCNQYHRENDLIRYDYSDRAIMQMIRDVRGY